MKQVHSTNLRALKAFKENYPQASVVLLYMDHEELVVNGVKCLLCEKF